MNDEEECGHWLDRPSQTGELELVGAVEQEALQVRLTDAPDGVDVGTGAVVLCEISRQTEQEKLFSGEKLGCNYSANK